MQRWSLTLTYDGAPFHGWQIQPGLATVQGTLAQAIAQVTGERVLPQGSGRTDAGVHALAQVASFDLAAPIPPPNLQRALNRKLPPSIRVLEAKHAPPDFHARHSALRKTYEYRIFPGGDAHICPPMLARACWDCPWPFALAPAQQAAAHVLGKHDFASFAASDPDLSERESGEPKSTLRTIFQSCWTEEPPLIVYRVTGSGFLHHMVRNLVGTFVDVARGHTPAAAIPRVLATRDRASAGPTAPAQGLFLAQVEYP